MADETEDCEVWDVGAEGTEQQRRVLKLLSLLTRSHHPNIRCPTNVTVAERQNGTPELRVRYRRDLSRRSLRDVSSDPELLVPARVQIAHELISVMHYLHLHGVFHNYLTSDDILVDPRAPATSQSVAIVSNFYDSSVTQSSTASYMCSRNYRPPEVVLCYKSDSRAVDVWLLGCLLFEVATGQAAFSLVSSKGENGVMKPMLVRQQVEQMVAEIGALEDDDVPAEFQPRHRDAVRAMKGQWRVTERLAVSPFVDHTQVSFWDALIRKCLQFNPAKRCDVGSLLSSALFDALRTAEGGATVGTFVEAPTIDDILSTAAR